MKLLKFAVAIHLVVVFFIWGCTSNTPHKMPSWFSRSAENQPVNQYYYFTEAQIQRKKGNLPKTIELLKQAIELDPESLYLKRELATVYLQNKDDVSALGILEGVLKDHPNDTRSLILYGGINQVLKDNQAAMDAYERVIAQDPKQEKVYQLLGGIYLETEDFDQAERVFNQMIDHFPDNYTGFFYLGKIYAKQGRQAEAEKQFERTLEIEP
ncbi:MAG: tetratricopeptide repeat protein, partial [Desulfobacterales bacterium]